MPYIILRSLLDLKLSTNKFWVDKGKNFIFKFNQFFNKIFSLHITKSSSDMT